MSYLIAAAGTGGHVYPGLAVGEALVDLGVTRKDILYAGGDRLEASVYPNEGFPFLTLSLRGLQRSMTLRNLTLPAIVLRAKRRLESAIAERRVVSVLGMGGYVTIPAALAARKSGTRLYVCEQNAEAGLANRIASRWADRTFVSFPATGGLADGEWVGNPLRPAFWEFDRSRMRLDSQRRYGLDPKTPVLGVFGGSLGAGAINEAVAEMVAAWEGKQIQVLHLTGVRHLDRLQAKSASELVLWKRIGFEDSMEHFYAASDLVLARAGGAVAELSATATPSILVPGRFGSSGHQRGNAGFFSEHGAAVTLMEPELYRLAQVVTSLIFDESRLADMSQEARKIAKPQAARDVARLLMEAES